MSRKFHLALFKPDHPRWQILDSHLEVIASLQWGFEACGIDCSVGTNRIDRQRTNILFGWIVAAQMGVLSEVPADTILYNFEQLSERQMAGTAMAQVAQRFQLWDYSAANLVRWHETNPRFAPYHAPVSYAPTLSRIAAHDEDIDVLYVGSVGPGRSAKLDAISSVQSRPSVVVLQNVWGATRDAFIGRSRLLANLSNDDPMLRIFEIVRVSYYLANRKAVVCEAVPGQHVEDDMNDALLFVPRAELAARCEALLADPAERALQAARGFEAFQRRDVRNVVRQWMS